PSVGLSVVRSSNQLTSTTPDFLGRATTSERGYGSGSETLTIRQPVYRRYQWAQLAQAEFQVQDVESVLRVETQNLAVRLGVAYFESLLAEEQWELEKALVTNYRFQLDAANRLFQAGAGIRTDIDETRARLDLALAREIEARGAVEYTRRQLGVLVNQPVSTLARLDIGRWRVDDLNPSGLTPWHEKAEAQSPELQVYRARVEVARQELEKAKAGHWPTLDAVAQWSNSQSENQLSVDSRYRSHSLGVQFNLPLYSGGGVSSAVRQALAALARAEQLLEAGRRDLEVRVQREYRGVTESVSRMAALEQAVRSADQALVSSKRSFEAGVRSRSDILAAESNRMVALRDLAQARYAYLMSWVRLRALVGDADEDLVRGLNSRLTAG
ncbi:MAG: TolC family outer membrane protein, partial [Rhodoferax sp.]|nr:TolC family outer membrane protein [Rhodoferax sp.]